MRECCEDLSLLQLVRQSLFLLHQRMYTPHQTTLKLLHHGHCMCCTLPTVTAASKRGGGGGRKECSSYTKIPQMAQLTRTSAPDTAPGALVRIQLGLGTQSLHGKRNTTSGASERDRQFDFPKMLLEFASETWQIVQQKHCSWCNRDTAVSAINTAAGARETMQLVQQRHCRRARVSATAGCPCNIVREAQHG